MGKGVRRKAKEIKDNIYYVVDNKEHDLSGMPKLLRTEFEDKKSIVNYLENNLPDKRFDYIIGSKAKELGLKFLTYKPKIGIRVNKYDYPEHIKSKEQRKIFRKHERRSRVRRKISRLPK